MDYREIMKNFENECFKTENTFTAIVDFKSSARRNIYVDDIEEGTGEGVEAMIRFYNIEDDEAGIPIEDRDPIKVYINSNGGLLSETFIMIDAINMSKTPVYTICTGTAYSGGFFTFICGHKRFAYPHSSFLFHEGSTSTGGTAGQFANYASFYKQELGKLKDLVIEKTGIDEAKYNEIQKDDFWMDAKLAKELNVVDVITQEFN